MMGKTVSVLDEELRGWESFLGALRSEDRRVYASMIASARRYADAIEHSRRKSSTESLFMAVLLAQHGMIEQLHGELQRVKREVQDAET